MTTYTTKKVHLKRYLRTETQNGTNPAIVQDGLEATASVEMEDMVIKGGSLHNWKELIATGNNACTSMAGVRSSYSAGHSHLWWQRVRRKPLTIASANNFSRRDLDGNRLILIPVAGADPTLDFTKARNDAIQKFVSQARSKNTKLKGMVVAGELGETLRMISSPAKSLRRAVSGYLTHVTKRGPRIPKRRRQSFVRDSYLEWTFGVAPLISDIRDGAKALAENSRRYKDFFSPVVADGSNASEAYVSSGTDVSGPLTWSYELWHRQEWTVRYFGIVHSTCPAPGTIDPKLFGFQFDEFIPTLWELIPYSFLVDYFTNIGDVIQAWSYRNHDARFVNSCIRGVSRYLTRNIVVPRGRSADSIYDYTWGGSVGPVQSDRVSFVRSPDVDLGIPSFSFQIPGLGDKKWVNIAALSKQLKIARQSMAR